MGDNDSKWAGGVSVKPLHITLDPGNEIKSRYGLGIDANLFLETTQGNSDGVYASYYVDWPITEAEHGGYAAHSVSLGYLWKTDQSTIKFRGSGVARLIVNTGIYVAWSPRSCALGIEDTVGIELRVLSKEKNGYRHDLTLTTGLGIRLPLGESLEGRSFGISRLIPEFAALLTLGWTMRAVDKPDPPATPAAAPDEDL